MNILIIDDLFVPEEAKADSSEKVLFCVSAKQNAARRLFLAKEFEKLGANVLVARLLLCKTEVPPSFEFSESGGKVNSRTDASATRKNAKSAALA